MYKYQFVNHGLFFEQPCKGKLNFYSSKYLKGKMQ